MGAVRRVATVVALGAAPLMLLSAAGGALALAAGAVELGIVMLVISGASVAAILGAVAADIVVVGIEDLRRRSR